MKWFGNDTDGISIKELEKIITGLAFILTVLAIIFMYIRKQFIDPTMVWFSTGCGTLFLVRKIAKYNLESKTIDIDNSDSSSDSENK